MKCVVLRQSGKLTGAPSSFRILPPACFMAAPHLIAVRVATELLPRLSPWKRGAEGKVE